MIWEGAKRGRYRKAFQSITLLLITEQETRGCIAHCDPISSPKHSHVQHDRCRHGISTAVCVHSVEGVEIGCDVTGLGFVQPARRHRRQGIDSGWVFDPGQEVVGRVRQNTAM